MDDYIRTGDNTQLLGVKEIDCSVGGKAAEIDILMAEMELGSSHMMRVGRYIYLMNVI